jgi:hypothetical protein
MKKFFKITLMTFMLSGGIPFSGESECTYHPEIDCLFCNFWTVPNNPNACMGYGSDCPDVICGGGPIQ